MIYLNYHICSDPACLDEAAQGPAEPSFQDKVVQAAIYSWMLPLTGMYKSLGHQRPCFIVLNPHI